MKGELVEQLRDEAGRNGGQGAYAWRSRELCGKAAAKILSLQSQLAAAQEKLARAEGALERYGKHRINCPAGRQSGVFPTFECACGLSTALAALREPTAEVGSV